LGLAVTLFQALSAENVKAALETIGDALNPFGLIEGELSPDSFLPPDSLRLITEECP